MQQTTENRGHLAFIQDQIEGAVDAFKAGDLEDCKNIVASVRAYIDRFLIECEKRRQ
jgi:hypothetical protein